MTRAMLAQRFRVLNPEQVEEFEREGFLIVRGPFCGAEMEDALAEADRLFQRRDLIATENIRCRWKDHVETKQCLFECFDPVIDLGPACARLARDPRLMSVVNCLYGEEGFLFKDKLIFKPPGALGYEMHQDFISWPGFPRSFLTAQIALEPADATNGCTEVFPGYHLQGYLSPEDGDYHHVPSGAVDKSLAVPLTLNAGDVAFFGCFTPHRSAPNRSGRWRRQLYLSYNAGSEGGDRRDDHYREFHVWLKKKYAEYGKHNTYFK